MRVDSSVDDDVIMLDSALVVVEKRVDAIERRLAKLGLFSIQELVRTLNTDEKRTDKEDEHKRTD